MSIAIYYKAPPSPSVIYRSKGIPFLAVGLMILGALLIGYITGPIVGYFIFRQNNLADSHNLLSPLPDSQNILGVDSSVLAAQPIVNSELDYRRPENWFPQAYIKSKPSRITHYNLSIPILGIQEAIVTVGGNDLSTSLIQYPGTANPGELGATVIFGHSILRQFYNPKNYISIFSKIMTLAKGDEIIIYYDGVKFRYRVTQKMEVKPTDVEILEQRYDGRSLRLVTCVPEGTYLRRGIIIAQLQ